MEKLTAGQCIAGTLAVIVYSALIGVFFAGIFALFGASKPAVGLVYGPIIMGILFACDWLENRVPT